MTGQGKKFVGFAAGAVTITQKAVSSSSSSSSSDIDDYNEGSYFEEKT
jgi:hypothetical protein